MSINRINVNGSSLLFSERKIFPLENGVWRGVVGLIKPPQLPGSAVPYSLLPISSLMNPLSTRGLNFRCNFILLYLPQGDFQAYRTHLSRKITLSYRTMSGNGNGRRWTSSSLILPIVWNTLNKYAFVAVLIFTWMFFSGCRWKAF